MPLPFPSVPNFYPWLCEAFDIVLLSKNLSWQDLRHSELDDDRRNDSMDHHYRVSIYIPMRYKLQCLLGDTSRRTRILQRRESTSNWIRCDRCLCRSGHTGATHANTQYLGVLLRNKSNAIEGIAFADASPAKNCRLSSVAPRLDVSMRTSTSDES